MKKAIILFILLSATSYAQLWNGIISTNRAVDWSNVGTDTTVARSKCGATINAGAAASTINTAISNCSAAGGGYVELGAGNFTGLSGITFLGKSNVTLRGQGANSTFLVFSSADNCSGLNATICMEGNSSLYGGSSGLNPDNTANWTAGYSKGTTTITLSSVANLKVGNPIALDQCDDGYTGSGCTGTPVDTGNIYVCENSDGTTLNKCNDDEGGTGGPSGAQRLHRGQIQMVTVASCDGNSTPGHVCSSGTNITITPGLYMPNWGSGQAPGAYWSSSPSKANGLENLSIDSSAVVSQSFITIWNCPGCWVKGVRSIHTTHNGGESCSNTRNHVWVVLSPRSVIRDSYFYGSGNQHSCSYGIEVFGTSDTLIENNIFQNMPSPQMINGSCSGCVVGYNYSINDANDTTSLFQSFTAHAGGLDNMNIEGNIGNAYRADLFHGTHHFLTSFRNFWNGWEPTKNPDSPSYIDPFSRYFNQIGNVFGRDGIQNNYQETPSGGSGTSIYIIGTGTVNVALAGDALTVNSNMRWGNYDTVNDAVRFVNAEVPSAFSDTTGNPSTYVNSVPASQTLPPSFYYAAKPSSWWGVAGQPAIPWPPIGPDVTGQTIQGTSGTTAWVTQTVGGHVAPIPAMVCYKEIMGGPANGTGSPLSFNASSCYVGSASGSPTADISSSSVVFTGQNLNTTSPTQSITITNSGTAVLTISSITLGGVNPTSFFQSNNCPIGGSLGIGSFCTVNITFTPLFVGSLSASISIVDNAADSPQTVSLVGTGVQQVFSSGFSSGSGFRGNGGIK